MEISNNVCAAVIAHGGSLRESSGVLSMAINSTAQQAQRLIADMTPQARPAPPSFGRMLDIRV
jgi:hypothetical protein